MKKKRERLVEAIKVYAYPIFMRYGFNQIETAT